MGVLRVNVLGPPEVFHDESRLSFALRKAQALLLYLAVEGGLQPRSKLATLLWPDSEPSVARLALRNALSLLRSLLEDAPGEHRHLLSPRDLLGLSPHAPLELDLEVVQRAWKAAQGLSAVPSEELRLALVATLQHALSLVRGPFLDGFWFREDTGFDEWQMQQQQQWQVRAPLLFDRLSSWQEAGFELEAAKVTLTRWLALDPLSEEAARRLMRLHQAQGDPSSALHVYATLRARLAEELRLKPSAETVTLAEHIRATQARGDRAATRPSPNVESRPSGEVLAPLIGRAAAFRQLGSRFEQAQQGQPQAVLLVGEAGIGKTRLAGEFVTWASAQGAEVLFAHTGGQPLYLLETLKLLRERQWLVPRLTAEGVFRLQPGRDLAAALTQMRSRRELLPSSVRTLIQTRLAKLSSAARQVVWASAVLGRPAPAPWLWQLAELGVQEGLEALEEAVKSGILREEEAGAGRPASYRFSHDLVRDVVYTELGAARRLVLHRRALAVLQSGGAHAAELAYHALAAGEAEVAYRYSVQAGDEALAVFAVEEAIEHYQQARALLQAQQSLQSVLSASEVEHLYVSLGRAYGFQNAWPKAQQTTEELLAYAQEHQLPALVSMTLNRLAILAVQQSKDKSQVQARLQQAWHMAQTSSDQRTLAETAWNWAQIIGVVWNDPKRALAHGEQALSLARAIPDQELEARSLSLLGWIHNEGGDFQEAIHLLEAALAQYVRLSNEPTAARELSLPFFAIGAPLTQPLTHRASEAWCWMLLCVAHLQDGQVQQSMASGRRALALSQESKNVWTQVASIGPLTYGLLEAGAYEEALGLIQHAGALARTLPLTLVFQRLLTALGSTYHAVQQWEEVQAALEEAVAVAERLDLGPFLRVPTLTRLCMHWAVAGQWEAASRYAVKAIILRKSADAALIMRDFYAHYETEALLHSGDERRRKRQSTDWENASCPIGASAFLTCGRWPSSPTGRGWARRPSPTCAKPRGWL